MYNVDEAGSGHGTLITCLLDLLDLHRRRLHAIGGDPWGNLDTPK